MTRVLIGTWRCPSGNCVDVFLIGEGRAREMTAEWDRFPLPAADELHYIAVMRPDVVRRAQEYLEKPGRALVIQL